MNFLASIAMVVVELDIVWRSEWLHAQCATPTTKHSSPARMGDKKMTIFQHLGHRILLAKRGLCIVLATYLIMFN